jgi:uncharacterized membrane protein YphA (DoxX/SURF4 family)
MNVFLWIAAIVLAALFLSSGVMKLLRTKDQLAGAGQGWVEPFAPATIKLIGLVEVIGAAGVILPRALDIAPVLTPLAALGLVVVMLGAAVTHGRRREFPNVAFNIVLAALALVLAIGRF